MAKAYNVSLDQQYALPLSGNTRLGMLTGKFNVTSSGSADLTGYFKTLYQVILTNPWPDASSSAVYHGVYSVSSGSLGVTVAKSSSSTMGVAGSVGASSAAIASLEIPFVAFGLL
jgi:hypothetical protein